MMEPQTIGGLPDPSGRRDPRRSRVLGDADAQGAPLRRSPYPGYAARAERAYRFGPFRLVPGRQLLLHLGERVRLGSRALDLLHVLVERAGELVSKEELIRKAWPNTFVDDSNLKVNISTLRGVLGRGRGDADYIATVPGRGYRFITPVDVEADEPSMPETIEAGRVSALAPDRPLVGRDLELEHTAAGLGAGGPLTIVGPAGVGKSVFALEVARRAAPAFECGAQLIDFTTIADTRLINSLIATALGLGASSGNVPLAVVGALRAGSRLLVFDNCEHLANAIGVVVDHIRASAPGVAVISTSREPLRYRSETLYRLGPLASPPDDAQSFEDALAYPAAALFARRARALCDYRLEAADGPAVSAICRRLEGLPLAIELAAGRTGREAPATILAGLDLGLDHLAYGPRGAPLRHQGLMSAIDWSYGLLSDLEAAVFLLASRFTGAFTCEDLIALAMRRGFVAADCARSLGSLVDKSLVLPLFESGRLVYRMAPAERCYANARLRLCAEA